MVRIGMVKRGREEYKVETYLLTKSATKANYNHCICNLLDLIRLKNMEKNEKHTQETRSTLFQFRTKLKLLV